MSILSMKWFSLCIYRRLARLSNVGAVGHSAQNIDLFTSDVRPSIQTKSIDSISPLYLFFFFSLFLFPSPSLVSLPSAPLSSPDSLIMAPYLPPKRFLRSDTALREQESIPYTEVVECSASVFKEAQSLFTNVCKSINQATKSQEFVYYDLDPDWGSLVSDSLVENDTVEASRARHVLSWIKAAFIYQLTQSAGLTSILLPGHSGLELCQPKYTNATWTGSETRRLTGYRMVLWQYRNWSGLKYTHRQVCSNLTLFVTLLYCCLTLLTSCKSYWAFHWTVPKLKKRAWSSCSSR